MAAVTTVVELKVSSSVDALLLLKKLAEDHAPLDTIRGVIERACEHLELTDATEQANRRMLISELYLG